MTLRPIAILAGLALAAGAQAAFSENFDSYTNGAQLHGMNGWKGWDNSPGAGALVTNAQAFSGGNSVSITGATDLVHEYQISGGHWYYDAKQFIDTNASGTSYFILMNTYVDGANYDGGYWSVQIRMDAGAGNVYDDMRGGNAIAMVKGQWVDLHIDLDLDANTLNSYYNGSLLSSTSWKSSGSSASRLGAVDLYAGSGSAFYDDINLSQVPAPSAAALLIIGGFVASGRSRPEPAKR